jgi:hypothetical protein
MPAVVDVARVPPRAPPGSGQVIRTQAKSSSGSPIVDISQSTIAASRAGAPCANITFAN